MAILNFKEFINESYGTYDPSVVKNAAGVAIIYDNKILLVHPTNASWQRGTCGIPKGKMEDGETSVEAALRELKEETGIILKPEQLETDMNVVTFFNKKNIATGQLLYYVCNISDLSEIGMDSLKISKSNLQLEEIDWAAFVSPKEAYPIMSNFQRIILDRHLNL